MSRKRALELSAAGYSSHYMGPVETGKRYCTEGAPDTMEGCGLFMDASEWAFELIQVEHEWELKTFPEDHLYGNRWYAGRKLRDWPGFALQTWATKERAEAYLKLLQEDWWDE